MIWNVLSAVNHSLLPKAVIKGALLGDCLHDVRRLDAGFSCQVGNGARDLQDAVMSAEPTFRRQVALPTDFSRVNSKLIGCRRFF